MTTTQRQTCDTCGGTKNAVNTETGEKTCNNRSCPQSPMNNYLTHKDTHIGKKSDAQ